MRELLVDTRTEQDEEGREHSFEYYILIDQMTVRDDMACESYGVKVARTGGGDEMALPNITTSISRIDMLMELLRRNLVTPTSLGDVVGDWL